MGNWIKKSNRGAVISAWGINPPMGSLIGSALGGLIVDNLDLHWAYLMFISAGIIYFMCLVIILFIRPYPEKMGCKIYENEEDEEELD